MLNRRPDIAQAERQLVAADATLASSQAQLLPSINLTATGSLQDRTLPDLLDNPLRLWSLGGSILAPLLNRRVKCPWTSPWPSATRALYSYEKRCAARSKRLMTAGRHQSLWRTVNRASGTRDRCPETLRIAQNRYRNGYSSYLDVLMPSERCSPPSSVVQVKNNLLLAQIDLYRALGGGWSDSSGS